jgi:hypothetical protein
LDKARQKNIQWAQDNIMIFLDFHKERVRRKELLDNFQNNNEEYNKIRNAAEEKVRSVLSDRKMVLKLALLSLIESMRNNPDKYNALIFYDTSGIQTTGYSHYYDTVLYGQQQQQYPPQDYIFVLIEEAEKLYNKLPKELGDESIGDCAFSTSSSSLPVLSQSDEKNKSHARQTTAANQSYMHTEEHRFIQSELIMGKDK